MNTTFYIALLGCFAIILTGVLVMIIMDDREEPEPEIEWEHPLDEAGRYTSYEPQVELKQEYFKSIKQ